MAQLAGLGLAALSAALCRASLRLEATQVGGSGVVRGGPEVRCHEGSTRVPPGFHQGSSRVPRGSARAAGWCEH